MIYGELVDTKVGDKLIVSNGGRVSILTVTKTTKTQVHCGNTKFNLRGYQLGVDKWSKLYAHRPKENEINEIRAEIRHTRLVNEAYAVCNSRTNLSRLTDDQLTMIRSYFGPVTSKG
jgi:hypothetical protein